MKHFFARFGIPFVASSLSALVTAAIVSYLWSVARHGTGVVDWETAVRMAIVLGIAIPVSKAGAGRNRQS